MVLALRFGIAFLLGSLAGIAAAVPVWMVYPYFLSGFDTFMLSPAQRLASRIGATALVALAIGVSTADAIDGGTLQKTANQAEQMPQARAIDNVKNNPSTGNGKSNIIQSGGQSGIQFSGKNASDDNSSLPEAANNEADSIGETSSIKPSSTNTVENQKTCIFESASKGTTEEFRCKVSERLNNQGHTVYDIEWSDGMRSTYVFWESGVVEIISKAGNGKIDVTPGTYQVDDDYAIVKSKTGSLTRVPGFRPAVN